MVGFPPFKNKKKLNNIPYIQTTFSLSIHLEKGMATHSSVLAWRILWTGGPGGYSSRGCKELDPTEQLTLSLSRASTGPANAGDARVTHSSILAWRIPWPEGPGGYSPWGHKESDMTEFTQPSTRKKTDNNKCWQGCG